MRLFIAISLFLYCFSLAASTPFERKVRTNGVTKTITFNEQAVNHLRTTVPHQDFQDLLNAFNGDASYDKAIFSPAGFCFIPIMGNNTSVNALNFTTTGFRVVLTLWKPSVGGSTQILPDEILFYGFDQTRKLADALDPEFNSIAIASSAYFEVTVSTTTSYPTSSVINASREFDLVFLNLASYESLATDTKWYPNGIRPSEGIMIERAVSSIKDDTNAELNHRNLVFRPSPIPRVSTLVPSVQALSYIYGYHCPPYWRRPLLNTLEADRTGLPALSNALAFGVESSSVPVQYAKEIAEEALATRTRNISIGAIVAAIVAFLLGRGRNLSGSRSTNDDGNIIE